MLTYETFWENSKNPICLLMRLFLDFFGNFVSHKLASEGIGKKLKNTDNKIIHIFGFAKNMNNLI